MSSPTRTGFHIGVGIVFGFVAFSVLTAFGCAAFLGFIGTGALRNRHEYGVSASTDKSTPWRRWESTSKTTGKTSVMFLTVSNNTIEAWLDHPRPELVVSCTGRKPEIYVDNKTAASVESGERIHLHLVHVRLDAKPAIAQSWTESNDSRALFAPRPAELLTAIGGAKKMVFEFTPFNAPGSAEAEFPVEGLKQALQKEKLCGL